MPFKDLRGFIDKIEKIGQLVKLRKELENGFEVSALGWEPRPTTSLL